MSIAHSLSGPGVEHITSPRNRTSLYSTATAVNAASRSSAIKVSRSSAKAWTTLGILRRSLLPFSDRISTVADLAESSVTTIKSWRLRDSLGLRQCLSRIASGHHSASTMTNVPESLCECNQQLAGVVNSRQALDL